MTSITSSTRPQRGRALFAGTIAALLATCLSGGFAQAEDAKINEAVFDAQSTYFAAIVTVRPEGDKWTAIVPGSVGFDAHIKIDTKRPGYVERVGVWLGECNGSECGASYLRVLSESPAARDYEVHRSISFPAEQLMNARTGATTYGTLILGGCNTKPVTEPHTFPMTIDATMSANTRKAVDADSIHGGEVGAGFNGGDVTRHDTFEITVRCLSTRSNDTVERKPDPHRTKVAVQDINLFLSTYAIPNGAQRGPSGTQCKPLKVTTRIGTDKAGPVNAKLWRQVNGGPITSETKAMNAEALGSGKFGDDWDKVEHFTQTTTVQYKAEILGGTFAPSTPWKSITIHCNGDYAPTQSNANPDSQPPAGKPEREVKLPPAVVTPPPACVGGKLDKTAGTTVCRKTAQLPDKDKTAERLRKARLDAAERRRKAAEQADRRRQAASDDADVAPALIVRPHRFGVGPVGPFQRHVYPAPQFQRVAPGSSLARMR